MEFLLIVLGIIVLLPLAIEAALWLGLVLGLLLVLLWPDRR